LTEQSDITVFTETGQLSIHENIATSVDKTLKQIHKVNLINDQAQLTIVFDKGEIRAGRNKNTRVTETRHRKNAHKSNSGKHNQEKVVQAIEMVTQVS